MKPTRDVRRKARLLNAFAMDCETAVVVLSADDYPREFRDLYGIKGAFSGPIPSARGFYELLREMCGDRSGIAVAERTERLFGMPRRVAVFEDARPVIDQLETSGGGPGPFYCVFDLMFCEYEGFTLCFITGTNN